MKKVFLLLLIGLLNFENYAFSSEETIKALKKGGKIIFQGFMDKFLKCKNSLTADFLKKELT